VGQPNDENFTWVAEKFLWRVARLGGMVYFRYASRPRSWPAHVLCNGYVLTIAPSGLTVFGQYVARSAKQ